MKIEIRNAEQKDIPEIAAIEKESFSDPWSEKSLSSYLSEPFGIFLAATDENGRIMGYIIGSNDGASAFVDNIAAAGHARRMGVGTALLNAFISVLPEGTENVALEVRVSNTAARGLYSRLGFKEAGIRKNLYSEPAENGIVMILEIKS